MHMHRCSQCAGFVKEAQSRKEENRFDWLILVCDVALVTLASAMAPSEQGSESLVGCEHISLQGKLDYWLNRVLE